MERLVVVLYLLSIALTQVNKAYSISTAQATEKCQSRKNSAVCSKCCAIFEYFSKFDGPGQCSCETIEQAINRGARQKQLNVQMRRIQAYRDLRQILEPLRGSASSAQEYIIDGLDAQLESSAFHDIVLAMKDKPFFANLEDSSEICYNYKACSHCSHCCAYYGYYSIMDTLHYCRCETLEQTKHRRQNKINHQQIEARIQMYSELRQKLQQSKKDLDQIIDDVDIDIDHPMFSCINTSGDDMCRICCNLLDLTDLFLEGGCLCV